jgi:hypothetical protein
LRRWVQNLAPVLVILASLSLAERAAGEDEECPDPNHLLDGVVILCGDREIVGLVARSSLQECKTDGATDCVATSAFKSVELAKIEAKTIRAGIKVAGVTGTFEHQIYIENLTNCVAESQTECIVGGDMSALSIVGLESKVLVGEMVSQVQGAAVSGGHSACDTIGQTGCLTVGDYPAIEKTRLDSCLGLR